MSQGFGPLGSLPLASQPGALDPGLIYVADTLSFSDYAATTYSFTISQLLGFNDAVIAQNTNEQTVNDVLILSDSLVGESSRHQSDNLILIQSLVLGLVVNPPTSDTLSFIQTVGLFKTWGRSHNDILSFNQNVTATVFGPQSEEQRLYLSDSVTVTTVINIEACDCLELIDDARLAIEETINDVLELSHGVTDPGFAQLLVLAQTVTTNAVEGSCCDGFTYYIPDKLVSDILSLDGVVSLGHDPSPPASQGLVLQDTASYYLVPG